MAPGAFKAGLVSFNMTFWDAPTVVVDVVGVLGGVEIVLVNCKKTFWVGATVEVDVVGMHVAGLVNFKVTSLGTVVKVEVVDIEGMRA